MGKSPSLDELAVDAIIQRCLAAADCCVDREMSRPSVELMTATFAEIADEVARWKLEGEVVVKSFLHPVRDSLYKKHDFGDAHYLYLAFVDAFWLRSWCRARPPYQRNNPVETNLLRSFDRQSLINHVEENHENNRPGRGLGDSSSHHKIFLPLI